MELNNKAKLNNQIILMRKNLKSIINQSKLKLSKNIKKLKESKKQQQSVVRKESELECFKRIKPADIQLCLGIKPTNLNKLLCSATTSEHERAVARVLLNPAIQKTFNQVKADYGEEYVETFLKENDKNIKKNIAQKLHKPAGDKSKKSKKKKPSKVSDSEGSEDEEPEDESEEDSITKEANKKNQTESKISTEQDDEEMSEIEPEIVKPETSTVDPATTKHPKKSKDKAKPRSRLREKFVQKSVDSFFMNSQGHNYESVAKAISSSSDEDERRPHDNRPASYKERKPQPQKNLLREPTIIPRRIEPVIRKPVKTEEAPEADLHPSWKAKAQMRKVQIQDFQGTKIKFDD